ncbi:MAG: hypothetical protein EOL88_08805 [Bacteroidia bacterium]|nr:DUF4097 domain-containing protein [Bacteroidales bacterium]NCD42177.1 hypothetical protein [Bacteroidia bacterium]MDD2323333.1 DUF4097 family beta strand repeat-containing protein [Bacteroidales bacterium]MDD3010108.1 DUF4097 family beta strand repeat-containing protein [Bacteroidales bacterium]MDD3962044.1 DUF4097 family beta strand repeat-containing protein [Bacteroidales bacterium]
MKVSILILSALFSLFSGTIVSAGKYTKVYEETFQVAANHSIDITNVYGDISVQIWDKNEVQITVTLMVEARNERLAEDFFQATTIRFSADSGGVTAKTHLSNSGFRRKNFSIDYVIHAPAALAYIIRNTYGDVMLPDLGGPVTLDLAYSNFITGRLLNDTNQINAVYSEGTLAEIAGGVISLAYSEVAFEKLKTLTISSVYSEIEVGSADEMHLESSYDEVNIGQVNSLQLASDFSDIRINRLDERFDGSLTYGELNLENASSSVENIYISATYADVFCGLTQAMGWKFLARTTYSDLKIIGDTEGLDQCDENQSTQVCSGTLWGNAGTKAMVSVYATNADITLEAR